MDINKVYLGDCLEIMPLINDKSIDLVLCDLPYGSTACSWDTVIPFEPLWKEYKRLIKDNGAIVLTASQPFTSALVMSNIKMFKYEWIWEKEQGTNQFLAKYQPLKKHENVLVFCEGTVKYNPQFKDVPVKQSIRDKNGGVDKITGIELKPTAYNNKGKSYPVSIIKANRELRNRYHPTQNPVALFEYLIKTYTNEGDLVLDNCLGSGTTAIACINLNRHYIGCELEKKYYDIALKRIEEAKQKVKLL